MAYDPNDFQIVLPKSLNITSLMDLDGATIIAFHGSDTEIKVASYFEANGLSFNLITFSSDDDMIAAFEAGRGDALAVRFGDRALQLLDRPGDFIILDPSPTPDYVSNLALLYEAGLGRAADVAGLNYWIDRFETGDSLDLLAANFLESAEFSSRFGDDDLMSPAQFVNVMYQNVLGRAGEQAGTDYWVAQMNGGQTREQVLAGFALSPENKAASTVSSLFQSSPGHWEFAGDPAPPPTPTPDDDFPHETISIFVGFSQGGPASNSAELFRAKLQEHYGTSVEVVHYTGAGGNLATNRVINGEPDGYTLLFQADSFSDPGLVRISGTIVGEAGTVSSDGKYGLFVPAGTPAAIIAELELVVQATMSRPEPSSAWDLPFETFDGDEGWVPLTGQSETWGDLG